MLSNLLRLGIRVSKRTFRLGVMAALLVLLVGAALIYLFSKKPAQLALDPSTTRKVNDTILHMYDLEESILCKPGTGVQILADVIIDSPDYLPSLSEIQMILKIFGSSGLTHPGYLTSQQAYFLSRLNPNQATPVPGIFPTQSGIMYCPQTRSMFPEIQSIIVYEDRIIAQYAYGGLYEVVLRPVNGRWMVSGYRVIQPNRG